MTEPLESEPPTDEVLAGELTLGVLNPADRSVALARTRTDPAFAAQVVVWERRLGPWLSDVAPAHVPKELWERLCRGLGWHPVARGPSWWSNLQLWRSIAAVAVVCALGLWVTRAPVIPPGAPEPAAKPVTELLHEDGTPGWLASVDRARGTVLMVPVPIAPDAQGRVPELWIIPAGQPPRSLGAVSISKAHTVQVPADARAALARPNSVLAITLEPEAGIPHPGPSGPVVAKGTITL
jgi:anti-sigma-K factor RskA